MSQRSLGPRHPKTHDHVVGQQQTVIVVTIGTVGCAGFSLTFDSKAKYTVVIQVRYSVLLPVSGAPPWDHCIRLQPVPYESRSPFSLQSASGY